jgi:hypothetical protein
MSKQHNNNKDDISFYKAFLTRSPSPESSKSSSFRSLNHDDTQKIKKASVKFIESLQKILDKIVSIEVLNENCLKFKQFCDKNRKYLEDLFEKTHLVSLIIRIIIKFYQNLEYSGKEKLKLSIKLTLVSCLADLCFYEKLRNHMKIDENCEQIIKSLSNENDETVWSKICRLAANFSQDVINIKYFLKDGEFKFLCSFLNYLIFFNFFKRFFGIFGKMY